MASHNLPPTFEHPALTINHKGKTRNTRLLPAVAGYQDRELRAIEVMPALSTHNVIHKSTVPFKDHVLTALTIFWRQKLQEAGIAHDMVANGRRIFDYLPAPRRHYPNDLKFTTMIVKSLNMIPVEFIFRWYLTGSLYREHYSKGFDPYDLQLPSGLPLMHRFPSPIFTPTDKSENDNPMRTAKVMFDYPEPVAIVRKALELIRDIALAHGEDMIDSKVEGGFDLRTGEFTICDEIATPDSSRYAKAGTIVTGRDPAWRDKQIARDEAERIWGRGPKVPIEFSPAIVRKLTDTYLELFYSLTRTPLTEFQLNNLD